MKSILRTNPGNVYLLIARLALAIVVFAHGAQKMFGWFGGYGFEGTMGFLTSQGGLSYFLALMVIIIETVGALFVLFGFLTRLSALAIFIQFIAIMFKQHLPNGFFMNWGGSQKGEGIEFFIFLLATAIMLIIGGGGKASLDAALTSRTKNA